MTLIIQIALGILLGYLLIEHRHRLGRWGVVALKALGFLVALAVAGYLAAYVLSALGVSASNAPKWVTTLWYIGLLLLGLFSYLIIFVFGGFGLILVTRVCIGRWVNIKEGPELLLIMGILGVLLTWPIGFLLETFTPYGEWLSSVDLWASQNDLRDWPAGLMSLSLVLWPWIVILVGERFGVDFYQEERASSSEAKPEVSAD